MRQVRFVPRTEVVSLTRYRDHSPLQPRCGLPHVLPSIGAESRLRVHIIIGQKRNGKNSTTPDKNCQRGIVVLVTLNRRPTMKDITNKIPTVIADHIEASQSIRPESFS